MKSENSFVRSATHTQPVHARHGRNTRRRLARAVFATPAAIETLECRRMLSVAINGSFTLDESAGLQTSGIAVTGEDNNDSDVLRSALPSTFSTRLFTALGLSTAFPDLVGVGKSADNYISVSATGTVTSLGFTKADGSALPVYAGVATGGVASGLSAVTGGAISLFADPSLGNRMVLGVDTNNDKVLAMFLDPAAALTSAKVWTVQFEPLSNPVVTNPDDPVTLSGLGVGAGVSTVFNFNALPSGQNLFGTVGGTSTALVVIGKTPVLNADGTFTNASNTINTSQGGGPTTIGVNNQMFDAGEGAYFTFVKEPDPNYLAGAVNGLDQNEADDADNIVFKKRLEATGGFLTISQTQGNSAGSLKITLFNGGDSDATDFNDDQRAFVNGAYALGTGSTATITKITVYNASGTVVQTLTGAAAAAGAVGGLQANFKVAWESSALHDQVLVDATGGKFDIGGFGVDEPTTAATPLTGVRFEDDGPATTGRAKLLPLTVDESDLTIDDTQPINASADFTSVFGQDGSNGTSFTYSFGSASGNSGLTDTASNLPVFLFNESGTVVGRAGADATAAASGPVVFTVSVDASGNVKLDQKRAVVHPDANNPDDTKQIVLSSVLVVTGTATDKDGDTFAQSVNDDLALRFKDDGPSITATPVGAPTLTVDDTTLGTDDTKNFAGQFTPAFGADGPGATPRSYALATPGGASGLVDTATGQNVVLSLTAGGVIEGRTATSGVLVFTVSTDQSGNVTLDQKRAVKHPNANDPNDATGLTGTNLVVLTGNAFDGDADSASANLDLTPQLVFLDDGPAIGPIANSIVDFVSGATVTKSLNGAVGADPNGTPYTIDSFTASLTINGVALQGVRAADKQSVTYWADSNHDTTFGNTGDTAFYRLTLNETGAGEYKFEVLTGPPPATKQFNFGDLPSGQNLFGELGDASGGLIVVGKVPVLKADGTFDNSSNTINTSQGGGGVTIGINNQMFDTGEGAYFTLVKKPDPQFTSQALDSNEADDADNMKYDATAGTLEVKTANTFIVQIQGNSLATMKLTAYDINGAPQGRKLVSCLTGSLATGDSNPIATKTLVNITAVRVTGVPAGAPTPVVTISGGVATITNLGAGYKIEWDTSANHDAVLIEDVSGKFDIGGFGVVTVLDTPDQKLDFVVRVTDGDGDFSTSPFSIGIDGTGLFDDDLVDGVLV